MTARTIAHTSVIDRDCQKGCGKPAPVEVLDHSNGSAATTAAVMEMSWLGSSAARDSQNGDIFACSGTAGSVEFPDLGDASLGCCWGTAIRGPENCTC
jgi:hypothetical protein